MNVRNIIVKFDRYGKPITVMELITQLQKLNPDYIISATWEGITTDIQAIIESDNQYLLFVDIDPVEIRI
jgi:hypothetical protein